MDKKYAVVKEHTQFGTIMSIMDNEKFKTCLNKCDVMFESDTYDEVSNKYRNYKKQFEEIIHV